MAGSRQLREAEKLATCSICHDLVVYAKTLKCTHTYCLECLTSMAEHKQLRCPECRQATVPSSVQDVRSLVDNRVANQIAELVRVNRDKPGSLSQTMGAQMPTQHEPPSSIQEQHRMDPFFGDLSSASGATGAVEPQASSSSNSSSQSSSSSSTQGTRHDLPSPAAVPVAVPLAQPSDGEMTEGMKEHLQVLQIMELLGLQTKTKQEQPQTERHENISCDQCKEGVRGIRYKCGDCSNYDLCEDCEKKADMVHNPNHVFLRVKKPTSSIRLGVLLKQEGRSFLPTKNHETVTCDFCKVRPIENTRFKCGCCPDYDLCSACEEFTEEIHDKTHIFMTVRSPMKFPQNKCMIKKALYFYK